MEDLLRARNAPPSSNAVERAREADKLRPGERAACHEPRRERGDDGAAVATVRDLRRAGRSSSRNSSRWPIVAPRSATWRTGSLTSRRLRMRCISRAASASPCSAKTPHKRLTVEEHNPARPAGAQCVRARRSARPVAQGFTETCHRLERSPAVRLRGGGQSQQGRDRRSGHLRHWRAG